MTILERSGADQQHDQGAGIRLADDVIDAIRDATGLQPQEYCVLTDHFINIAPNGHVVMDQPTVAWCTNWRQLFLALLGKFKEAGKGCYRHDCYVENLKDEGSAVTVNLKNATGQTEPMEADIVVAADGLSSTIRELLAPGSKREYVGYVILRGLVERDQLSPETLKAHATCGAFCFNHDSQIISYWVPAGDGPVSNETQVWNWGWYSTYSKDELEDLMTGKDGRRHRWALPAGAMKDSLVNRIKAKATADLPRVMAEGVEKTEQPFVQVISDMVAPENVFMDGKVVLIGDAVAGQRPHTASSCTQCCYHGLLVAAWVDGKISLEQMSKDARDYSNILVDVGKQLSVTQDTTLPWSEKAKSFFSTWFPTQARLTAKFKQLVAVLASDGKSAAN